jgi:DNA polymerase III subunit gamma/tau
MSYTVFYRKYRPGSFDQVIGQEAVTNTLLQALKTGNVSHAYLLCGPRGTGKTTLARLIAKGVNCLNLQANGEPCNQCEICTEIKTNQFADIIEIDAASNRSIDDIRDLKEKVNFMPLRGKKKVYIIDEVHMLTKEAFNALLKTLEEPPAHVHFILATTERHKVPATIISRTQSFLLKPLSEEKVIALLQNVLEQEKIVAEAGTLEIIALASEGGVRDALTLLEQSVLDRKISMAHVSAQLGFVSLEIMKQFFDLWQNATNEEKIVFLEKLYTDGVIVDQFIKQAIFYARQQLHIAVKKGGQAKNWYIKCLEQLINCERQLHYTPVAILALELAYLSLDGGNSEVRMQNAELSTPAPKTETKTETRTETKIETQNKDNLQISAPVSPPTPAPQAQNSQPSTFNSQLPPSDHSLQTKWQITVQSISHPTTKMALRNSDVRKEDDKLIVYVNSQFELAKVNSIQSTQFVRNAIVSTFGTALDVTFKVKEDLAQPQEILNKVQAIFGSPA